MAARNIYIKYLHPYSIPPMSSESVSNHCNGDLALLVSLWKFSIFLEIRTFNEERHKIRLIFPYLDKFQDIVANTWFLLAILLDLSYSGYTIWSHSQLMINRIIRYYAVRSLEREYWYNIAREITINNLFN
eukprot:NODE_118_length_18907_cov_0.436251.p6 type:complete len:131 gc:universal NODE_118_length_18907_cov_0.436251:14866-14474(-)